MKNKNILNFTIQGSIQKIQMRNNSSHKFSSSSQVQNAIQLKHKINTFKHHIMNLENTYSKKKSFSNSSLCNQSNHLFRDNQSNLFLNNKSTYQSNLLNRYQKEKLKCISKQNNSLIYKMIKIDQNHSQYHDPNFYSTFTQIKNNFLVTKLHDRKRSLTQIAKENKTLNKKLLKSSSGKKLTSCNQWKKDWGKNIKTYSQNLSNKFPRISYDYRALAYKQINKQPKLFNRLRLKL